MTMTFSLHDSIGPDAEAHGGDNGFYAESVSVDTAKQDMHILEYKLKPPGTRDTIERTRITSLLTRSVSQFPATLVSGRAGSGKTALAAAFASKFSKVAWYSIESTDAAWSVFSRYFSASLHGSDSIICRSETASDDDIDQSDIAKFLVRNFAGLYSAKERESSLIVLDDIHHLFDAGWFDCFFNLLIPSLPSSTHILLLCRSKPPSPLWRLRSKQMLNVLDERVIAFNANETEELFEAMNLPLIKAKEFQRQSFGRISKILRLAEDQFSIQPNPLI